MEELIVKVDKDSYSMFDDMIFYRGNGRYKSEEELNAKQDFSGQYAILDKQLLNTYAMQIGDKFVGYICAAYIPKIGLPDNRNGYMYVDDLWVNPNYRRMGIAEKLMKRIADTAKESGYYGLRLYVNTNNGAGIALYEKCGYKNIYGTSMMMERVL